MSSTLPVVLLFKNSPPGRNAFPDQASIMASGVAPGSGPQIFAFGRPHFPEACSNRPVDANSRPIVAPIVQARDSSRGFKAQI
jgi:hypothetical protein